MTGWRKRAPQVRGWVTPMPRFFAGGVQPNNLAIFEDILAIDEDALRDRKVSHVPWIVILNRFRDGDRPALQTQAVCIKRLRRQSSVFHVKQISVAVRNIGSKREKLFGGTPVERCAIKSSQRLLG